ncbi:putative transposable element [Pseudoloma neurophilia]|uniref:Putative transposable element n=1 Tax=Pseudoloma neurophilia TaxID=146866 RepID=A0A0R0LY30_9MICR|nr:putative transposable element [Pseudoloma neurophilia]
MRKTKGSYKQKINKIISSYNDLTHRGLGMSPNQALLPKNYDKVLQNSLKYAKEFKEGTFHEFNIGDSVIIKNENKNDKMDDEYKQIGKVIRKDIHHSYRIQLEDGSILKRHSLHLKIWPGHVRQNDKDSPLLMM